MLAPLRRIVELWKAMLVLPMSRALASLTLESMRKMNLALVVLNLGLRGFGKLGDGNGRHNHKQFSLSSSWVSAFCASCLLSSFLVVFHRATLTSPSPATTTVIRPSPNYYMHHLITWTSLALYSTLVVITTSTLQPNLNQRKLTLVIRIPCVNTFIIASLHCIITGLFSRHGNIGSSLTTDSLIPSN
jgi:hypothetical protein